MEEPIEMVGDVVRKRINPGSKSDHVAVVIVSPQGEFKLRRRGGDPFADPALLPLVGKRIRATGIVSARQLIMDRFEILEG
jgi:hypothetical protein